MMSDAKTLLYLFSSNIRPLYEQDILDLLAFPIGTAYQFRYREDHVSSELLRMAPESLVGRSALIHFSIQDLSQYHEAAFVPVRYATVTKVEKAGDILVLRLKLGDYIALNAPTDKAPKARGAVVASYRKSIEAVPHPYDSSAGIGPELPANAPVDRAASSYVSFRRAAEYLQGTKSFAGARFFRVEGISRLGRANESNEKVVPDDEGVFELVGGDTYAIEIIHRQPADKSTVDRFTISVDEKNLRVIGKPEFEIASAYDVISVAVHAIESATNEVKDTVVSIDPVVGVQGPKVRLRIRVRQSTGKAATAIAGTALVALFLGVPTLWPTLGQAWKASFIIAATLLTGTLASFGLKRG